MDYIDLMYITSCNSNSLLYHWVNIIIDKKVY